MATEFMTSPERRAVPRYRIKPDTFVYFYPPGSETATIQDLSLGGMYVVEDKTTPVAEGAELDFELRVLGGTISLRGVVTRVNPEKGFAVRFTEYSSDVKDLLKERFQLTSWS